MQIHHYQHETGEYIGSGTARPDPLDPERVLVPAHATATAPPEAATGQCAVFSGGAWALMEDHRGQIVYETVTGAAVDIEVLGPLPDSVTLAAPGECETWNADVGAWSLDAEAWAERVRQERDALLAASDFRMVSDAPWDTALWAVYRQALRDLPQQEGFPWTPGAVEWPEGPA